MVKFLEYYRWSLDSQIFRILRVLVVILYPFYEEDGVLIYYRQHRSFG